MKIIDHMLFSDNNTPVRFQESPNHGGILVEKSFIIFHFTNEPDVNSSIKKFIDPRNQVSAHIIIARNGGITQCVPFNIVAWHAGISSWKEYNNLNAYSVGIELENAGMLQNLENEWLSSFGSVVPDQDVLVTSHKNTPETTYGWHKYTDIQINTAVEIAAELFRVYGFREILGHDDISPKRKWDPGPAFPMEQIRHSVMDAVSSKTHTTDTPPQSTVPAAVTQSGYPTSPKPAETDDLNDLNQKANFQPVTGHYKVENLDTHISIDYSWSTAFKPVVLLPVPFIPNSGIVRLDCGFACVNMLLKAYLNIQLITEEFDEKFNVSATHYANVVQLRNGMGNLGLLTEFRARLTVQDLFTALAAGKAPIVLLRHKILEAAGLTAKQFDGPFFVVVVGMDIKNVYVHDPLYENQMDGDARAIPLDIFWNAWKNVESDPQYPEPERSAIIPTSGIGFKLARTVKVNQISLNIRSGPGTNYPVVGSAKKGEYYDVSRELGGWGEVGENRWLVLAYTLPV